LTFIQDLTAADTNGDTALHLAIGTGKLIVATILLDSGASVSQLNIRQQTPFDKALALQVSSLNIIGICDNWSRSKILFECQLKR
jgi:ankyrin repeat protein